MFEIGEVVGLFDSRRLFESDSQHNMDQCIVAADTYFDDDFVVAADDDVNRNNLNYPYYNYYYCYHLTIEYYNYYYD